MINGNHPAKHVSPGRGGVAGQATRAPAGWMGVVRTSAVRNVLARLLPVLVAAVLVIAGVMPPQHSQSRPAVAHGHAAVDTGTDPSDVVVETAVEAVPADHTSVLVTQHTAGVRGSRGPPASV